MTDRSLKCRVLNILSPRENSTFGRSVTRTIAVALIASTIGCGGQSTQDSVASATSNPGGSAVAAAASSPQGPPTPQIPATDVVSQFLDMVRRGGADTGAEALLTSKAQSELNRIGRKVEPMGTPDTRVTVTRAEMIPDDASAALVHTIWSEPATDGSQTEFQVVWAVQNERGNWRISGFAMQADPDSDPMIINFEDGQAMAAVLAETERAESAQQAPQQASSGAANATFDR